MSSSDTEIGDRLVKIGDRMVKIRYVLKYWGRGEKKKFAADFFGIEDDTYGRWENGQIEFPVVDAGKLVMGGRIPGLTLDWIYLGGEDRLRDGDTARALAAAPPREEEPGFRPRPERKAPSDKEAAAAVAPLPGAPRKRTT